MASAAVFKALKCLGRGHGECKGLAGPRRRPPSPDPSPLPPSLQRRSLSTFVVLTLGFIAVANVTVMHIAKEGNSMPYQVIEALMNGQAFSERKDEDGNVIAHFACPNSTSATL